MRFHLRYEACIGVILHYASSFCKSEVSPQQMRNNYAPGSHDWCFYTKHVAFANKCSFQKVRNNYAPGSHDWLVPNTLLHLHTNLFNYISLFCYISLLIILAYCLLPIARCIRPPNASAAECIRRPNA